MPLKDNFCPSPWFHMRINNSGHLEYCRWTSKIPGQGKDRGPNIKDRDPIQWFQKDMAPIRQDLLMGGSPAECSDCQLQERHNKVSGRQRQLLKAGIDLDHFEKTTLSSPWMPTFVDSLTKQGHTDQWPQDWQIDLGNFCNSACLFCSPQYSSRIATEHIKLGLLEKMPEANWSLDPASLDIFLKTIENTPTLTFLHFLGGETLITPAFAKILQRLVDRGINKKVGIGFTTNLTVWNQPTVDLLKQFAVVNFGVSIECLTPLNEYVRYGGDIKSTLEILDRWTNLAKSQGWIMTLRTTPTVLTVPYLYTVFEYGYQNDISTESCNFLSHPEFMRASVLPKDYRQMVIERLQSWIENKKQLETAGQIVNTRNPSTAKQQNVQDASSYINYLRYQPDESHRLLDLVSYLKMTESVRGNNILEYLPEYENLLRSAGY